MIQKNQVEFVVNDKPELNTDDPFQKGSSDVGRFVNNYPWLSREIKPYAAAANKQMSAQVMIAGKGRLAVHLKIKKAVETLDEFDRGAEVILEIAQRADGTERAAYMHSFAYNYLNYLQTAIAKTTQIADDRIDDEVEKELDVRPGWRKLLFGG